MLSKRTLNDPAVYMRLRGHPPTTVLECAICPPRFQARDGVAFPIKTREGNIVMGARFARFDATSQRCPSQLATGHSHDDQMRIL